ncbi:MAG: TlpA family protein disulfide reductase [Alphaproteobacteria bacterium]|uniref:TlpA family protein disulfide reductase n=1 Tax=Candidatus Nitrobium versatile TaxID=2884831 RepID=A0A953LYR5_9BACT|nr:TlpA family protein disulfide reductase [Candidatus Nitrobium versatile]
MKRVARNLVAGIVAFSCVVLLCGCKREKPLKIGLPAPEISALDLQDKRVRLADYRGKSIVIRFWSSTCKACVDELPAMDTLYKRYKAEGLVVLAVNIGDSKETVETFIRERNLTFPVLLDSVAITAGKYGVHAVPTTFLIDREGVVRKAFLGETPKDIFEIAVRDLL